MLMVNLPLRLVRILVMLLEWVRRRQVASAPFPLVVSMLKYTIDCWRLADSAFHGPPTATNQRYLIKLLKRQMARRRNHTFRLVLRLLAGFSFPLDFVLGDEDEPTDDLCADFLLINGK